MSEPFLTTVLGPGTIPYSSPVAQQTWYMSTDDGTLNTDVQPVNHTSVLRIVGDMHTYHVQDAVSDSQVKVEEVTNPQQPSDDAEEVSNSEFSQSNTLSLAQQPIDEENSEVALLAKPSKKRQRKPKFPSKACGLCGERHYGLCEAARASEAASSSVNRIDTGSQEPIRHTIHTPRPIDSTDPAQIAAAALNRFVAPDYVSGKGKGKQLRQEQEAIKVEEQRKRMQAVSNKIGIFGSWKIEFNSQGELQLMFHSQTRIADMECLLVDPGAFDNLVGSAWVSRIMSLLLASGLDAKAVTESIGPIGIGGVGKEGVTANTKVSMPIMLSDGTLTRFDAPVLQNVDPSTGKESVLHELPALLGLKSLEAKNAVLDMRPNQRKLYIGDSNHVRITPMSDCTVLQLLKSESGHLMLPVSCYDKVKKKEVSQSKPDW